jgi:hemerythrin-like domain-containing protein
MDFFTLLKQDHREAKETFQQLFSQPEVEHSKAEALYEALLLHMELEENYFYPVMHDLEATRDIAEASILEHQEAKKAIRTLQGGTLDDVEYKTELELLQVEVEHHIKAEEGEVFPKAKKLLSEEQIQTITDQMTTLKQNKTSASKTWK